MNHFSVTFILFCSSTRSWLEVLQLWTFSQRYNRIMFSQFTQLIWLFPSWFESCELTSHIHMCHLLSFIWRLAATAPESFNTRWQVSNRSRSEEQNSKSSKLKKKNLFVCGRLMDESRAAASPHTVCGVEAPQLEQLVLSWFRSGTGSEPAPAADPGTVPVKWINVNPRPSQTSLIPDCTSQNEAFF